MKYTPWVQDRSTRSSITDTGTTLTVVFGTNKDMETLSEKVGKAVVNRLYSIYRGRWIEVEGPDYRLISP